MQSLIVKLRRGEGPVWGPAKRLARQVLAVHVPVVGVARPVFRVCYTVHVAVREGVRWVLRFFWFEPLFRSQCAAVGPGFQMEQLPYLVGHGRIVIGAGVRFSGKSSIGFSNRHRDCPELTIGDGSFLGHGCILDVAESIQIGRHCLIATGTRISDQDGHPLDPDQRRRGEPTPASGIKPVRLGDDVWVGAGATILKGVTIGDRSIVGAGAVVTRDVPPDVIVAGNPARQVAELPRRVDQNTG
jgi:acetyltransferase-like isoleucine patch superfamily enzyme